MFDDAVTHFEAMLPDHKCGLHLTHNQHKDYYEPIEMYLTSVHRRDEFDDPDLNAACIAADSIWELQWYPSTPVGSHTCYGPTLQSVMEQVAAFKKK